MLLSGIQLPKPNTLGIPIDVPPQGMHDLGHSYQILGILHSGQDGQDHQLHEWVPHIVCEVEGCYYG